MHIKLETLRTFITVADCGTLQEAASVLKRTPSAISMALKQMEEQLGAELFETDRKSVLTPLGYFVLEEGRRALIGFDEAMCSIQRFAGGEMGTVRVATVPSVATRLLPEVVQGFQVIAPRVRLELRDLDSAMVATAVRNGSVDFGIASVSPSTHDLERESLLEEPFGVVCRKDHALAQSDQPVTWRQLKKVDFISNDLCKGLLGADFSRIHQYTHIHIYNVATLLSFIQQGMGVTLLPRLAVPEQGDLCFLPLADKQAVRRLYFLQHRHHRLNPAALAFKEQVLQVAGRLQNQQTGSP